jgi:hypothetical protein
MYDNILHLLFGEIIMSDVFSSIAACVAAISSVGLLLCAVFALKTWEKQEHFKARQEFKRAIILYIELSQHMPSIAAQQQLLERKSLFSEFVNAYASCRYAWSFASKLFNRDIEECWEALTKAHRDYMSCKINITEFQECAEALFYKLP